MDGEDGRGERVVDIERVREGVALSSGPYCTEDMVCKVGELKSAYLVTPSVPTTDTMVATTIHASLPVTGADSLGLVWVALIVLACGIGAVLWAKITS